MAPPEPAASHEYTLSSHRYAVSVSVPAGFSSVSTAEGSTQIERIYSDKMQISVRHTPDQLLRVFFTAVDNGTLPEGADGKSFGSANGGRVFQELNLIGLASGRVLRAVLLDLAASEEDGSIHLHAGGFPPILLVRAGQFTLPGRSGIPCGVVPEHRVLAQYIDWQPGDEVIIYSEGTDRTGDLRSIHEALAAGQPSATRGPVIRLRFLS